MRSKLLGVDSLAARPDANHVLARGRDDLVLCSVACPGLPRHRHIDDPPGT